MALKMEIPSIHLIHQSFGASRDQVKLQNINRLMEKSNELNKTFKKSENIFWPRVHKLDRLQNIDKISTKTLIISNLDMLSVLINNYVVKINCQYLVESIMLEKKFHEA